MKEQNRFTTARYAYVLHLLDYSYYKALKIYEKSLHSNGNDPLLLIGYLGLISVKYFFI